MTACRELALRGRRSLTRILTAERSAVIGPSETTPSSAGPRWAGPPRILDCGGSSGRICPSRSQWEAHLEGALDLQLQVRRPADRRLRGSGGRPLVAVQKHPWTVGGPDRCLARWWCLTVECCLRGEDFVAEFRIRYCRG